MEKMLRWGILGTGMIARKFAGEVGGAFPDCLVATGSRRLKSAESFAQEFGGTGIDSYEAVLKTPGVEAVYIALPNGLHHEWGIRAMEAGKHVLCEKPIACNAREAVEMFEVAKRTGRTLVEAFMYRTHPAIRDLVRRVRGGELGEIRLIRSNFSFSREIAPKDARYHQDQAGGGLMDVGCYCTNFCRALAGGEPTEATAVAHLHGNGVDDYAAGLLRFGDATLATFTCGMTVKSDWSTHVAGTLGQIHIESPWFTDGRYTIVRPQGVDVVEFPADKDPYAMEAEAFAAAARGEAEPWITAQDTQGNMRVLDQLRNSAGVPFPA